jgi:hypothetical protein
MPVAKDDIQAGASALLCHKLALWQQGHREKRLAMARSMGSAFSARRPISSRFSRAECWFSLSACRRWLADTLRRVKPPPNFPGFDGRGGGSGASCFWIEASKGNGSAALYCGKSEIRLSSLHEQSCASTRPRRQSPIARLSTRRGKARENYCSRESGVTH